MDTVRVTSILNPLQPLDRENRIVKTLPFKPGRTVRDYVRGIELLSGPEFRIAAAINGKPLEDAAIDATVVEPDDSIVYCSRFRGGGGGGGGKNIMRSVAMVAVMVAAVYTGGAIAAAMPMTFGAGATSAFGVSFITTGGAMLAYAGAAAVAIGGSMLVNNFFPTPKVDGPDLSGFGNTGFETSTNYGWSNASNAIESGTVFPVLYGEHRVHAPLISRHVTNEDGREILHVLYGCGEGPWDDVTDVYINGNPVEQFTDVTVETRLGHNTQDVIPGFGDIYADLAVNKVLGWDYDDPGAEVGPWVQAQTYGNATQGLRVLLTAPQGLFYANDEGGLSYSTVYLDLEYQREGDDEWLPMTVANAELTEFDASTLYKARDAVSFGDGKYWCRSDMSFPRPHWSESRDIYDTWTVRESPEHGMNRVVTYQRYLRTETTHHYTPDIWEDDGEVESNPPNNQKFYREVDYKVGDRVAHDGRWWVCIKDYECPDPTDISWWTAYPEELEMKGNSSSPMAWTLRVDNLIEGRYKVRARFREKPQLRSSRHSNAITLSTLTEIQYDDLCYPNTVLCGIKALATDQLSGGLPTVSVLGRRLWVDVWDGEKTVSKPATNPAWAAYDILSNSRYGAEGIQSKQLIYDDFAEWAQHCDDNGFTCNVYFDSSMSTAKALDTMGTLGHAIIVSKGARIGVVVNKPAEPVQMFTAANIIAGTFKRSWLEKKDRANYVEVTFWNRALDYEREIVPVISESYVEALDEERKSQTTLVGCTDKKQALAHGKFLLNTNEMLTQVVQFEVDIDAIASRVGDVVLVQHPVPMWGDGGRCEWYSPASRTLTLAKDVTREPGEKHQVLLRLDDTDELVFVDVEPVTETTTSATVTLKVGNYKPVSERKEKTYTVDEIGAKITCDTVYSVGKVNSIVKPFRISSITRSQDMRRKITAMEYSEQVYNTALKDESLAYTYIDGRKRKAVSGLRAQETWERQTDGTVRSVITLNWDGAALAWQVYLKEDGGKWTLLGDTRKPTYKHVVDGAGELEFSVCTGSAPDTGQTVKVATQGKAAPPSDVEFFAAVQSGEDVLLRWQRIPDADILGYEVRVGQTWETGEPILDRELVTEKKHSPQIDGTYTYWIKAWDTSGHSSRNATSASVNVAVANLKNIILDIDELTKDTPADGAMDDMVYRPVQGDIILLDSATNTDLEGLTNTDIELLNQAADHDMTGAYTSQVYDLGVKSVTSISVAYDADTEIRSATNMDIASRTNRTFPMDTNTDITSTAKSLQWCRTSDDNVSWSEWAKVKSVVTVNARYYQLRWTPVLDVGRAYFAYKSMRHRVDVPDKVKRLSGLSVPEDGLTVTYADDCGLTFFKEVGIGVGILGAIPLRYTYTRNGADGLGGITINLFDDGGSQVAGTIDLTLHGF